MGWNTTESLIERALQAAEKLYSECGKITSKMVSEAVGCSWDHLTNRGLRMAEVYEYVGCESPERTYLPKREIFYLHRKGMSNEEIAEITGVTKKQVYSVLYRADLEGNYAKDTNEQPCWSCAKATGGCVWSASRAKWPVRGWVAEKARISNPERKDITSYKIEYCPEYKHDGKSKVNLEEKMEDYYGKSGVAD